MFASTTPLMVVLGVLMTAASQCVEKETHSADGGVCGVVCPGARPFCDEGTTTCVECLANADCEGATPTCSATHACIACASNADCAGNAGGAICDVASGACGPCTNDAACSGIAATPVCREQTGACVACTPDSEATTCGDASCHRQTFTCTTTDRRSVGTCEHCQADSECAEGDHCVPMTSMGTALGFYCLHDLPGGGCGATGGNTAFLPFSAMRMLTSADGIAVQSCGPHQSISCEGILASGSPCLLPAGTSAFNDNCGNPLVHDGVCAKPASASVASCAYACITSNDCRTGSSCNASSPSFCE